MAGSGCGSYYQDPATGQCTDAFGNIVTPGAVQFSTDPSSVLGSPTPTPATSDSGFDWSALENDILTGFRAITQPNPVPPGQAGVTVTGAKGGLTISGSPIILFALVAIAFFALRKG